MFSRWTVLAFAACAAIASACAPTNATPTTDQALVARGEYLVTVVAGCNDCHTPMTPQGPDMSRSLQGTELGFAPLLDMPWAPHAPSIAGMPEGWTEQDFAHFLQTAERPSGVPTLPPMPMYHMTEEDARAVAAYVRSLPKAES